MDTKTYVRCRQMGLLLAFLMICGLLPAQATGHGNKPVPANSTLLKFNLKPGEKYMISTAVKQVITFEAMGNEMTMTQHITTDYLYDILSVHNGISTINVSINAVNIHQDLPGFMTISFDSERPDEGAPQLKVLGEMVGKSFVMEMNEEGTVRSTRGLSEALGSTNAIMQQLGFTDSLLTQSMNQTFQFYPNKAVAIGEQWAKSLSVPMGGIAHADITSTYSLAAINGRTAMIDLKGDMHFSDPKSGTTTPRTAGAEFNMAGTLNGTLELDIESGLPLKMTLKQDISGDVGKDGKKVPMHAVSEIVYTGRKQ